MRLDSESEKVRDVEDIGSGPGPRVEPHVDAEKGRRISQQMAMGTPGLGNISVNDSATIEKAKSR